MPITLSKNTKPTHNQQEYQASKTIKNRKNNNIYIMRKALLLLLLFPLSIMAQVTGTISGKMIDGENNEPLGFVTVAVTAEGSSLPTAGCTSDIDGNFTITGVKAGNYTVQFSFVGYMSESRKVSIKVCNLSIGITLLLCFPISINNIVSSSLNATDCPVGICTIS